MYKNHLTSQKSSGKRDFLFRENRSDKDIFLTLESKKGENL